jgi:hypothetical protein
MTGAFFAGLILGLMVDGLGHNFSEERIFGKWLIKSVVQREEETYKGLVQHIGELRSFKEIKGRNPITAEDLYPIVDKAQDQAGSNNAFSLKDYLVNQFYSYHEFYQNSGISIFLVSFIFPLYMITVVHFPILAAIAAFIVSLSVSILLLASAAHTLMDYRKARMDMIEAAIIKKYRLASQPPPPPVAPVAGQQQHWWQQVVQQR